MLGELVISSLMYSDVLHQVILSTTQVGNESVQWVGKGAEQDLKPEVSDPKMTQLGAYPTVAL